MKNSKREENIKNLIFKKVKEYYNLMFSEKKFQPSESKIHYAGRVFDEEELINLVDSALDFWLTEGRFGKEFTQLFSEFLGIKNVLLVNSGSSANLLAISALTSPYLKERKLNEGDEVITVATGFPTTVSPIIQNKLTPVFVDIDLKTYNISCDELENAISEKTKAIFVAHTMGNPINLTRIQNVIEEYKLWLIEDCCDALGSKYKGKKVGTFGDIATFSFYPSHHITMGEGGAVVTNDKKLYRILKSFRDWGRDCYCEPGESNSCGKRFSQQHGDLPFGYDHKYVYSHIGYNLKLTDMQAAIGVAQMKKLPNFIEKRKENFKWLYKKLQKFDDFLILPEKTPNSDPSWFGFVISVKENDRFNKNMLVEYLEKRKIETRNLFAGNLLKHPAFKDIKYRKVSSLKNTNYVMNNTFFIGVYPGLNQKKLSYIYESFESFFNKVYDSE